MSLLSLMLLPGGSSGSVFHGMRGPILFSMLWNKHSMNAGLLPMLVSFIILTADRNMSVFATLNAWRRHTSKLPWGVLEILMIMRSLKQLTAPLQG